MEVSGEIWIPGSPVVVQSNSILGRFTVAARRIEKDDLIGEEYPLVFAAYSPSEDIRPCLSCCKDINCMLNDTSKTYVCSNCKWPICSIECESAFQHSDYECRILAENKVLPPQNLIFSTDDYICIEVLRTLLIKDKNKFSWERIIGLEAHLEKRSKCLKSIKTTEFVKEFIRGKCRQVQFDPSIVDRIVGVIIVNSLWIYKDCQRYVSALYEKLSLIPNDCNGNTKREVFFRPSESEGNWGVLTKEYACREINPGEIISSRYSQVVNVNERREVLKSLFHFDCNCTTCLDELGQQE